MSCLKFTFISPIFSLLSSFSFPSPSFPSFPPPFSFYFIFSHLSPIFPLLLLFFQIVEFLEQIGQHEERDSQEELCLCS